MTTANPRVRHIEDVISQIMQIGLLISMAVIGVGLALMFIRHPGYVSSSSALHPLTRVPGAFPHSVSAVIRGLSHGEGQAVVVLGLFLLLMTPVVRVAASVVLFETIHDRAFVAIASMVLIELVASIAAGTAGAG